MMKRALALALFVLGCAGPPPPTRDDVMRAVQTSCAMAWGTEDPQFDTCSGILYRGTAGLEYPYRLLAWAVDQCQGIAQRSEAVRGCLAGHAGSSLAPAFGGYGATVVAPEPRLHAPSCISYPAGGIVFTDCD